jgi:hypothetical protein
VIVDYNYKIYADYLTWGVTQYIPPAKNNKGLIVYSGYDNRGDQYYPTIVVSTPTGGTLGIELNTDVSGSFNDLFMQFKRETTTDIRTSDIVMPSYRNGTLNDYIRPSFFPISYQYINWRSVGNSPDPTFFGFPPCIITLY